MKKIIQHQQAAVEQMFQDHQNQLQPLQHQLQMEVLATHQDQEVADKMLQDQALVEEEQTQNLNMEELLTAHHQKVVAEAAEAAVKV